MAMYDPFKNIHIQSLDPQYDFREASVVELLNELGEDQVLLRALPTHRVRHGKQRLRKLKWAILADSQSIRISRGVYENERDSDEEIDALVRACLAVEGRDEGVGSEPLASSVGEPSSGSSARCAIVDAYGLYVPSLADWLRRVQDQLTDPEVASRTKQLYDDLVCNIDKDGPAVIVSPGKLHELFDELMNNADDDLNAILSATEHGETLLIKLTLLHEIGHHVYPVPTSRGLNNLSEAMANWFAYCCLNYDERHVLHIKTLSQAPPYRMYQGLLALRDPSLFVIRQRLSALMPKPSMGGVLTFVEQEAFEEAAVGATGLNSLLEDEGLDEQLYDWNYRNPSVNPAHLRALIILHEAYGNNRYGRLAALLNGSASGAKPQSKAGQIAWHHHMWKIDQVINCRK